MLFKLKFRDVELMGLDGWKYMMCDNPNEKQVEDAARLHRASAFMLKDPSNTFSSNSITTKSSTYTVLKPFSIVPAKV